MQLDEEKLEALRSWGERLGQASDEEFAAVGRAILMLVEEINRLHIELWHARIQPRGGEPVAADATVEGEDPVASSLQARVRRVLQRDSAEPMEQAESDTDSDRTTSPQAWIAALRRQK